MNESEVPCSKFCKYLNPEEEKRLILKATDSIDEFSDSQPDDPNEKYAIPAKWWHKW